MLATSHDKLGKIYEQKIETLDHLPVTKINGRIGKVVFEISQSLESMYTGA